MRAWLTDPDKWIAEGKKIPLPDVATLTAQRERADRADRVRDLIFVCLHTWEDRSRTTDGPRADSWAATFATLYKLNRRAARAVMVLVRTLEEADGR